jgi:hypothetical protein
LALFRQAAGLKLEYTRGAVYGADEVLGGKGGSAFGRLERNLGFRSMIREMHLGAEIFPVVLCRNGYVDPPAAGPYLSCGMGYYKFSPETMWNGQWHALHPLRTEGQGFAEYPGRKMYALAQFNVGGGAGMRWRVSEILALRLEICYRFLWTDYLDDVSSTYVDPKLFDKYLPPERAMLARQLYSRKKERDPAAVTTPGDQRGNPGNRDSYFTILIKTGFIPARKRK